MAVGHYLFNDTAPYGRILRRVMSAAETVLTDGKDLLATVSQMIDGDGSSATQFTYVTARFGFPDNATAKAAWEEFQSFMGKFTGDGDVSSVNAAMLQAFAKFR